MADTTNWEWININRSQDVTISIGSTLTRNNWVLTRKRISDASYSSELGDTSSSLSGYNGGVTETVTPPLTDVINFDTATNWTATATDWIPSGATNNGAPVYVTTADPNIPSSTKINIIFLYENVPTGEFGWKVYESVDGSPGPSINYVSGLESDPAPSIDGYDFDTINGSFTGTATASVSQQAAQDFYCSGDNQVYNQSSVDWFTQQQTWIFKDGFQ